MTKTLLEKIIKTLNILNAPFSAVAALWFKNVQAPVIVASTLGLLSSVAEYLKLFAKDS